MILSLFSGSSRKSHERVHERCQDFLKATERLADACAQPYSEFLRDSVIQRFEFCWELAWKVLRLKLLEEGIEALTPREVFREALAARLLHDGNAWSQAQRMRNLTSHTYDESLAEEVYRFVCRTGLPLFQELAQQVRRWSSQ